MNPFRFLLLPLAAILLCVSCGQKQSTSVPQSGAPTKFKPEYPIHIQLSGSKESNDNVTLADLVADIQYIPLETKRECLIGNTYEPRFYQDFIFIQTGGGTLLQFNRQGKFVRRINIQGKGPGECTVRDYGIDEKNRLIHIFDNRYLAIYTFTFEGKYIKTLRNPLARVTGGGTLTHFGYDETKGNFFFSFGNYRGNMQYKYVVTDPEGNILYKCPNYIHDSGLSSSVDSYPIYRYDNSYYYQYMYNDTIFRINGDYTCSPVYVISMPNRLTLQDNFDLDAEKITPQDMANKAMFTGAKEDVKYLYIYYTRNSFSKDYLSFLSLYEKATGSLVENINLRGLFNDWDGGMDVTTYAEYQTENRIYLLLQSYDLIKTLTAEHFAGRKIAHPDKAEALKKLVSTLKEEDNPVLMIITMKK